MTRTQLVTLAGLAGAVVLALQLERAVGMGVVSGYLFGAAISLLGVAWQGHVARVRPRDVMRATVESFLAQLGALLVSGLSLRFVEPLAPHADWRAFLLAYAFAAFLCLVSGSFDTARLISNPSSASGVPQGPSGVQKGQVL